MKSNVTVDPAMTKSLRETPGMRTPVATAIQRNDFVDRHGRRSSLGNLR